MTDSSNRQLFKRWQSALEEMKKVSVLMMRLRMCANCGGELKKKGKYSWTCPCSPDMILSIG